MVLKCCVPGCKSNYRSRNVQCAFVHVTVFRFPKNVELKNEWLRKIPRDINVTKNTVVCIKHFDDDDVILYKKSENPDDKVSIHLMLLKFRIFNTVVMHSDIQLKTS